MRTSQSRLGIASALSAAIVLSGCSYLGIATHDDLALQRQALERTTGLLQTSQQEDLARATAALRAELDRVGASLDALQKSVAATRDQVKGLGDLSARMSEIDEQLAIVGGELETINHRVDRDLRRFDARLVSAANTAEAAEAIALGANVTGRRVADAYLDDLQSKRRAAKRALEDLDETLSAWGALEADLAR